MKTNLPALSQIQAAQIAVVESLQSLLNGATLTPEQKLAAADFLAGAAIALAGDQNFMVTGRLEDGARVIRLRDERDATQWGDAPGQREKATQAALGRFGAKAAPAAA